MTNLIRRGILLATLVALVFVTGCREESSVSPSPTTPATTPNMNTNSGSTQGS